MIRIEYFIHGHHQPELSFFGEQSEMPQLPVKGLQDIKPFEQNYLYWCVDITSKCELVPTSYGVASTLTLLIDLSPLNEISLKDYHKTYGDSEGNFKYPRKPIGSEI